VSTVASRPEEAAQGARLRGLVKFWAIVFATGITLALDPLFGYLATKLPSIIHPTSPAYYMRYLLMHAPSAHEPGEARLVLIGSSVVRDNLDERVLAGSLSGPKRRFGAANLGLQGAFTLSVVILANQLRSLHPDLVVWGVNADTLSPNMDGFRDDVCPWRRPMAAEFGASALYSYVPGLKGRYRALSDEFTLKHWALYRYRLYYRQYLLALYRARKYGRANVFGPYASNVGAANRERLEAALARRLAKAAAGQLTPPPARTDQVEAVLGAVDTMVRAGGGRLAIVWLPTALDGQVPAPQVFALAKSICASRQIPFIDLRGVAPASSFRDTLHATADGKRQTTEALVPRLQVVLGQMAGGGQ
jgi:hypothetical protein